MNKNKIINEHKKDKIIENGNSNHPKENSN